MQIKIQTSLLSILLFFIVGAHAQSGLNFQGVARNTNNIILASQPISLRLSIIRTSVNGPSEYSEIRKVTTNAQGLFAVVIGDTGSISSIGNFANIDWKLGPKFLKIEMDVAAGNNFILLGTTQFQSVAYAQFANSVDAEKLNGIVPVEKGGTGTTSLAAFKTALSLDKNTVGLSNVNNTADTAKPISNATKLALDTKVSTLTFSNTLAIKADTSELVLKAPIASPTFTGTVAGITKEMVGLSAVDNTSDINKPISTATQTVLDTKVSSTTFSITLNTKVSTETFSSTIATKEDAANKSTATDLGAGATSDILFPTQKAVKSYVDAQINSGGVADGGITNIKIADGAITNEKVSDGAISWRKLNIAQGDLVGIGIAGSEDLIEYNAGNGISSVTNISQGITRRGGYPYYITTFSVSNDGINTAMIQDGAVTNDKVATGISKSKVGLDNVENTALSTWTGSSNLNSLGTIASGTWSGTTIALNKGGTGASNAADARANLGLVIGTNVQAPLSVGVDYLEPNGSAANLTNFPTLNQNTTGNAGTATLAGNISATSNNTLTTLQNLSSIGTIASGIWSGTTIALNKGGTGATNALDARANLGLVIGTNVQAPLSAGIDYLEPSGSAANLTNFPTLNQNTTGNAGTATLSGNISATSNNTLTILQNLASVGTITTGVWSGTTINVSNGGTGSTNLPTNNILLGNGVNALQTIAPGNSGNILVSNGTTWSSAPLTGVTAGNLTGTTLASNIISSSLTSVGVLTNTIINGKLVVGATSEVSSSAILEVNSTSKGFIPPRMSQAQRNAIVSPASGLTIWCNNCGSTGELQVYGEDENWYNINGNSTTGVFTPTVGQVYQGGIVAYLLVTGDFGYDANIPHGLIVAKSDMNNGVGVPFWNGVDVPLASNQNFENIGYGYSNTMNIINTYGGITTAYAAGLANSYRGGGYNDWYLPSVKELEKIYLVRNTVGGFSAGTFGEGDTYWTSSMIYRNVIDQILGISFASNRSYRAYPHISISNKIRPVRSF